MFSTSSDKKARERLVKEIYDMRVPPREDELIAAAVRKIEGNPQLMHSRRNREERFSSWREEDRATRRAAEEERRRRLEVQEEERRRRLEVQEEERRPALLERLRQARKQGDHSAYTLAKLDLLRRHGDGIDRAADTLRRTITRQGWRDAVQTAKNFRMGDVPAAEPSLAPGAGMETDGGEEPRPSPGRPVQPEKDSLIDASSSSDDEDEDEDKDEGGESEITSKKKIES